MELLGLDEAQLQVGLQHLPHELRADFQACIFLDLVADQLGAADGLAFPVEAADRFLDGGSLVDLKLLTRLGVPQLLRLLLGVSDQVSDQLGGHTVPQSSLLLGEVLGDVGVHDLLLLLQR